MIGKVFAGKLASLDTIRHHDCVGTLRRRINSNNNDTRGTSTLDGRLQTALIDGGDDDQVHTLLNERRDLVILSSQIKLSILNVQRSANLLRLNFRLPIHGREERIGHILHHQANALDLRWLRCLPDRIVAVAYRATAGQHH